MATGGSLTAVDRVLRRVHRLPKKVVFGIAAVLGLSVVLTAEPRTALVTGVGLMAAGLLGIAIAVRGLRRTLIREAAQDERWAEERHAAEKAAEQEQRKWEKREARHERARRKEHEEQRELTRLRRLLRQGNVGAGADAIREFCADSTRSRHTRFEALMAVADRYRSVGEEERARGYLRSALLTDPTAITGALVRDSLAPKGRTLHFDVLHVCDFGLPDDSTDSSIQEIRAQTASGMRTGLLTTPTDRNDVGNPVNPKVIEVVDNDRVRFVHWSDRVTCDLMIIRNPKVCEHIVEDLPHIRAAHTMIVVDQPPFGHREDGGEPERSWDISRVRAALGARGDEYSWHPIGPGVRDALVTHHAAEMRGVRLADEDWVDIVDLAAWQRTGRRVPDGKVRIGRHCREDPCECSETSETHPWGAEYEVHVLGGTAGTAGPPGEQPPGKWLHEAGTMTPLEFLHGLDVCSHFPVTDRVETGGRAPLEAMAAGVPTIMPPSFKALFGDAGVYTEPSGVRAEIDLLMADPALYQAQVDRAWQVLGDRFSHEAHIRRLAAVGVGG